MSQTKLSISDLRAGDVLLYHGDSFLSKLIRAFDGTDYSHAGIYDGTHVVEAIGDGVVMRTPAVSADGAKFVDVFRYKHKDGTLLGDPELPSAPVLGEIHEFTADPERYAYEQLVFLAVLAGTRKIKIPGVSFVLRNVLDAAASALSKITSAGKEPVICSELVYRCYQGAGPDYKIAIKGADLGVRSAAAKTDAKATKEEKEIQAAAKKFLSAWSEAQAAARPAGMVSTRAVADFVTPGDLSKSPNLAKQGRLDGEGDARSRAKISFAGSSPKPRPRPTNPLLTGDGSFGFVARVEGEDIVVERVACTWFGGTDDPMDSGETASGFSTARHPDFQGCALPMDQHLFPRPFPACDGSPIPKLPWFTEVRVERVDGGGSPIVVPLIDIGPSKLAASRAAIDLTKPAFQALGGSVHAGRLEVNFRIIGGAQFAGAGVRSVSVRQSEMAKADVAAETSRSARFSSGGGGGGAVADGGHGTSNPHAKPPIRQFIQSPNFTSRGGAAIERIVLHYTEGSTAQGAINTFLDPGRGTSAHYIVDRNGDIYQMVKDSDRAHHCRGANANTIGIEHVAVPGQSLTQAQEQSAVALIRWLMEAYHVPIAKVDGHRWTPGYASGVNGTDCPHSLFGPQGDHNAVSAWVQKHLS